MADDLTEAEQAVAEYKAAPFENIPGGPVIVRLVRQVRLLTAGYVALKARVDRLDPP